ncbi:MAG: arabinosidase [Sphingobacteriales bacterium]|nr:MAG: arabinosidase [Sphingobacteriales bacterium]
MRFIFLLFTCCFSLLFASCNKNAYLFTSFHEPADAGLRMLYSYDGKNWNDLDRVLLKPEVGNQKVMRDPSMVQGPDGTFHMVWTSSWRGDKGFGYASSKNLISWSEQQFILVMDKEPATVNVWAPELFYDEEEKRYLIIWASCIPGRFERGIEDVIDAVIVKRSVKDYALVLKDNTRPERTIKVAFADNPLGPWTNISKPFSDKFTEGPSAIKLKNEWLIYFDSYQKKIYEAMVTKDFVQFENVTTSVQVPKGHKHGTIVPVKKKFIKQLKRNVLKPRQRF